MGRSWIRLNCEKEYIYSMATEEPNSLLVIIIDTNPVWWGKQLVEFDRELKFTQYLHAVMVFANAHLMLNHQNKLAVIAAHTDSSKFVYPKKQTDDLPSSGGDEDRMESDGKYELFQQVDDTVAEEIKELILGDTTNLVSSDSLLAGAMSMALCYIHRLNKEKTHGETISSRILVIKGTEDNPSQYMNLMNVVFTAQKQDVTVDACILDKDSGLLQQACDITSGQYLRVLQPGGLLQYLMWLFLPDPSVRKSLVLPARVRVDYRAACFCHRTLIDIGYVCSVCLSVFCTFSPICSTCHTAFRLPPPIPKAMKKKTKRTSMT